MSTSIPPIPQPLSSSTQKVRFALMGLFLLTAALWFSSRTLLATNFLPHWYCYVGNQRLVWTNVIADLVIGLSYVAISATLVWLVRRAGRDLPYSHFFWAFGLFIVSCGGTHFMEVLTVWKPVYWLSAAVKVVTAAASAGTAVVLLVAADDILEFVHTARESAARRGNEQFRALINAAPMAVVGSDLDGKITAWNPAAERMFGWTALEAIGNTVPMTPPDCEEETQKLSERTLAGAATTGYETERLTRTGKRFPVSISAAPVFNELGVMSSMMRVIEDISERKRIALELQEKTHILRTVTHALNTFLESGDWSAASLHLLKFAIRETQSEYGLLGVVLGGSDLRLLAHDGIVWDANLNRDLYEGKIRQFETAKYFEVKHVNNLLGEVIAKRKTVIANSLEIDPRSGGLPSGHPSMSAFLGVPIFKGQETVGLIAVANRPGGYAERETGYLHALSQATGVLCDSYRQSLNRNALEQEQKRLESQVRQSQKMEVLGRLAGGVAHDFNNMLMVIAGFTDLLDRALDGESATRIYLDQILKTTEKAAAITKQLLAFSRKQVFELRPMDLHEALTESEFMLPRLLGSDIELTFSHQASQSWILSDPSQIAQVIANLAINSRDAMPEGGRLIISTRNSMNLPAETDGASSLSGHWVVLEVIDTGCGMDQETRAHIFEPFFTTKAAGKGTGLGLSTAYGIVKQSGGQIRVQSAPAQGTRFEIYFPVAESGFPAPRPSSVSELAEDSGQGVTILVADDEVALRHAIVEILRTSGYTVLESNTAQHALEIAREHRRQLDVLLTDIVMPGMRGTELAHHISQINPQIKVVYMSGYAEGYSEAQLPPNSIFLQKPFRFATLLEQLKLVRRRA
jgi:PAS domain S-box-containing protein